MADDGRLTAHLLNAVGVTDVPLVPDGAGGYCNTGTVRLIAGTNVIDFAGAPVTLRSGEALTLDTTMTIDLDG